MTLHEFNSLQKDKKTSAVWNLGVEIGERKEGSFQFELYSMDSFYVEFIYKGTSFQGIRSFCSTILLEPYLNEIELPKIVA